MDLKYLKISKQRVTQHSFCLAAIDYYLKYWVSQGVEKHTQTQNGPKKTWKWPLEEEGIKWKKFSLCSDCQSNTKTIRVLLRPGSSGDIVVKSKPPPRSGSVLLKGSIKFLKICKKFHEKILNGSQDIEGHTPKWAQKYAKMARSRGVYDMKSYF